MIGDEVIQCNRNTHHQAVHQMKKKTVHPYKLLVCQLDVSPFVLQPFIEASVLYCHSAVAQAIFQVVNSREVSQTPFSHSLSRLAMSNDTSGSIIEPQYVINGPTIHQSDIHFLAIMTNVNVLKASK